MSTNDELKPKTRFPLNDPILKTLGIPKTEVDLEMRFLAMKTYNNTFITMWLPPSNSDIPKHVESALKFANIPPCLVEKIVKYFKDLVYWPSF